MEPWIPTRYRNLCYQKTGCGLYRWAVEQLELAAKKYGGGSGDCLKYDVKTNHCGCSSTPLNSHEFHQEENEPTHISTQTCSFPFENTYKEVCQRPKFRPNYGKKDTANPPGSFPVCRTYKEHGSSSYWTAVHYRSKQPFQEDRCWEEVRHLRNLASRIQGLWWI